MKKLRPSKLQRKWDSLQRIRLRADSLEDLVDFTLKLRINGTKKRVRRSNSVIKFSIYPL
jgi:hypothetical protein